MLGWIFVFLPLITAVFYAIQRNSPTRLTRLRLALSLVTPNLIWMVDWAHGHYSWVQEYGLINTAATVNAFWAAAYLGFVLASKSLYYRPQTNPEK